jgi:hypothetical protein
MSTGSDELASQAEILQSSISFFKMDGCQQARKPEAIQKSRARASILRKADPRKENPSQYPRKGTGIDLGSDSLGTDALDRDFVVQ